MPMDERTKQTVRTLLDRHPRGHVEEVAGFTVTNTAAGLFRLLVLAILGGGHERLSWLVGALALVDARGEYDRVRP